MTGLETLIFVAQPFVTADQITLHAIGDYILQNDWQAQGKKKLSAICAVHCLLYTLTVLICTGWGWSGAQNWWLGPAIYIEHFIQDRWGLIRKWMHLIGQDSFASPPLGPWSIIVVDNVFHLVFLWGLSKLI